MGSGKRQRRESVVRRNKRKQPSLPKNWPNSTPEDIDANPKRLINVGVTAEQDFRFNGNSVKTSKYELWNFIPKFLLEEFNPYTKFANCYFLLIAGLQCIKTISNTGGYPTTLLPLLVVLVIDGIFLSLEDLKRHKADREANSSTAYVYNPAVQEFEPVLWSDLVVGDFIRVEAHHIVPADVVILGVAEKTEAATGICYVETKSLDGETNLKIRNAMPTTYHKMRHISFLQEVNGSIEMEHPNKLIDSFAGVLDLGELGREAIQPTNLLLRGCVLRNTDWVVGIIVNTGHDTKIMMTSTETKVKSSFLEICASKQIQKVIIMLVVVAFTGSIGQVIWNKTVDVKSFEYLGWNLPSGRQWVIQFFYLFLLHASFIPVSLYVSMSAVRFFQSYFMNNDLEMYYEKTDTPAVVRTMTLNEELGQISHIFSDKTGTLTCNTMDFRKASINGVSYGLGITEIGKASWKLQGKPVPDDVLRGEAMAKQNSVPHVSFYCPKYEDDMAANRSQAFKIRQFFRFIAICHDVIVETSESGKRLSASNPDDEALVCAAAYFGYSFCDRREKTLVMKNKHDNKEDTVEVLETIAFTSARKRMSVIFRDADGSIKIITKGADSAMFERLRPPADTEEQHVLERTDADMRVYAQEGLRCLVVAYKEIDSERFANWVRDYRNACRDVDQIERKKRGQTNVIDELEDNIERELTLVGATAIEDRLQDGVPECIASLAQAGINIWVLTGDKEETAINIAVACNLVLPPPYMKQIVINKRTAPTKEAAVEIFQRELAEIKREHVSANSSFTPGIQNPMHNITPRALIIDGPSLIDIMADGVDPVSGKAPTPAGFLSSLSSYFSGSKGVVQDADVYGEHTNSARELLLKLSTCCRAVVGCRVSPDQKREMVRLIKFGIPGVRTLAVGDGANDVAMIQEGHVGVGIKGEEGVQAVNASDYAIAQFRYLSPLLLKHGRFNYVRMSNLVCFVFYKNILFQVAQFWFNFLNGWSGQKLFTEWVIQCFNVFYTSIPILMYGVYDMDLKRDAAIEYPFVYQTCIRNENFSTGVFWQWIIIAILESVVCTFLSFYYLEGGSVSGSSYMSTHWEAGALCFTALIIVINAKICFITNRFYYATYGILFLSVGTLFAVAFIITYGSVPGFGLIDFEFYGLFPRLMANSSFWMALLNICTIVIGKDLIVSVAKREWRPSPVQILQEMEAFPNTHQEGDVRTKSVDKLVGNEFSPA